jgi:hypothetical protein
MRRLHVAVIATGLAALAACSAPIQDTSAPRASRDGGVKNDTPSDDPSNQDDPSGDPSKPPTGNGGKDAGVIDPPDDPDPDPGSPDAGTSNDGGFIPAPSTAAITLKSGDNSFDLGVVSPTLAGSKINMVATISGTLVILGGVEVQAAPTTGVRVTRIRFAVKNPGAAEVIDPNSPFALLDQSVPAKRIVPLGAGYVQLGDVQPGAQVRILFGRAEVSTATVPNNMRTCAQPNLFTTRAVPAFKRNTSVGQPCTSCHGRNGGASAGLNLGMIDRDNLTACSMVLDRVRSVNRAGYPTPAGGHAGGTPGANFAADVNAWLGQEPQ